MRRGACALGAEGTGVASEERSREIASTRWRSSSLQVGVCSRARGLVRLQNTRDCTFRDGRAGEARTFAKGRRAFNRRRQPKGGRVPARALGRFRFGFWKKAGRRRGKGYSGPAKSAGAETEVWRVWAGPLSDAKGGGEEDTRVMVVRGGGRGRQGGKEWA